MDDVKKCPNCSAVIPAAALRCRHCMNRVDELASMAPAEIRPSIRGAFGFYAGALPALAIMFAGALHQLPEFRSDWGLAIGRGIEAAVIFGALACLTWGMIFTFGLSVASRKGRSILFASVFTGAFAIFLLLSMGTAVDALFAGWFHIEEKSRLVWFAAPAAAMAGTTGFLAARTARPL